MVTTTEVAPDGAAPSLRTATVAVDGCPATKAGATESSPDSMGWVAGSITFNGAVEGATPRALSVTDAVTSARCPSARVGASLASIAERVAGERLIDVVKAKVTAKGFDVDDRSLVIAIVQVTDTPEVVEQSLVLPPPWSDRLNSTAPAGAAAKNALAAGVSEALRAIDSPAESATGPRFEILKVALVATPATIGNGWVTP